MMFFWKKQDKISTNIKDPTNILLFVGILIPNIEVNTVILISIDISQRWCNLSFGPFQGQIKPSHFPERIDARKEYFLRFIKISWIIDKKQLGQLFWIMI